ncbi:cytochrome c [Oryzomicrobium terrae]|uniref:Cytochrome c n=1 Tax=Oryzomicrobium terrae TaxID=1735038 RepID=A0A5C1E5G7_9RHOO|nr:c-type cytochrome [Oryzomicrobium terrae]QEL64162.1 cytochrome c [Oryzomicrobium terrae]
MSKTKMLGAAVLLAMSGVVHAAGPAKPDLARAEEIVGGRCFLCHGAEGESSSPIFPRLAGQNADYVAKQLADFQSGRRKSDTMQSQVQELTADEMTALGLFFAAKKPAPHRPRDVDLAGVGRYIFTKGNPFAGVAACSSCHGAKGYGTTQLPRLAGQHPLYIEEQLKQFNKRERTNDNAVMHAVASKLTELEVKAVAEYIGALD